MSLRKEQCNKVCKILDDVLVNRPTERDTLITAVRTAFEEPKWTPCSEKLPEEEYVLISKKPTKLSGSKWCVTVAIRMEDPRSRKVNWRDIGFGVIPDDNVLAWMLLPEPYREERKTDETNKCGANYRT